MHNEYLHLTTTGFALANNSKGIVSAVDFKDSHNLGFEVCRVIGIKELYHKYNTEPTHENYLAIVNLVIQVVGNEDVGGFFFKGQANNSSITPLTTCFIEDLLSGKYMETHYKYNVATTGLKLSLLFNNDCGYKLEQKFKVAWNLGGNKSWLDILSLIFSDKEVMQSFVRYVFID